MDISESVLNTLAEKVATLLSERKLTISTAESCTGGWVGKELTGIPGSSKWYGTGFITYSNQAKHSLLKAGPTGGTKDKPVGSVCFAYSDSKGTKSFEKIFSGSRDEVRRESVKFILEEIINNLNWLQKK